jgi:amino-acid N-acetyltransferase
VTGDVAAIHALIADHAAEGRLLPRAGSDIAAHLDRFVVATVNHRVVGCADLARLSPDLAEVRSLVVAGPARSTGVGRMLLRALIDRAARSDVQQLCAFTHSPAYFVRAGFSIVPHAWLPEKIAHDCRQCASFRRCGQSAMVLPLFQPQHPSSTPVHG